MGGKHGNEERNSVARQNVKAGREAEDKKGKSERASVSGWIIKYTQEADFKKGGKEERTGGMMGSVWKKFGKKEKRKREKMDGSIEENQQVD